MSTVPERPSLVGERAREFCHLCRNAGMVTPKDETEHHRIVCKLDGRDLEGFASAECRNGGFASLVLSFAMKDGSVITPKTEIHQ